MSQGIKHGMIVAAFYISFPFASFYFLKLAEITTNPIIHKIVGVFSLLFILNCIACLLLLSDELQKAKDAEMYKRQADYYAKLYYKEVKHHGKTTKKENETS